MKGKAEGCFYAYLAITSARFRAVFIESAQVCRISSSETQRKGVTGAKGVNKRSRLVCIIRTVTIYIEGYSSQSFKENTPGSENFQTGLNWNKRGDVALIISTIAIPVAIKAYIVPTI